MNRFNKQGDCLLWFCDLFVSMISSTNYNRASLSFDQSQQSLISCSLRWQRMRFVDCHRVTNSLRQVFHKLVRVSRIFDPTWTFLMNFRDPATASSPRTGDSSEQRWPCRATRRSPKARQPRRRRPTTTITTTTGSCCSALLAYINDNSLVTKQP